MTAETTHDTPTAPDDLAAPGLALWSSVVGMERNGQPITFRSDELAVLATACRTVDMIARLEAELADAALVVEGSKGQVSVHPVVSELRLQRGALASLLRQLAIPDEASDWDNLTAAQRARRAAHARWAG